MKHREPQPQLFYGAPMDRREKNFLVALGLVWLVVGPALILTHCKDIRETQAIRHDRCVKVSLWLRGEELNIPEARRAGIPASREWYEMHCNSQ